MFRLTREVRFAINAVPDEQLAHGPANSYGGYPSLTGLGYYFAARVTLAGELEHRSQYLINIKQIDAAIRQQIGEIERLVRATRQDPAGILLFLHAKCREQWGERLEMLSLVLTPFLSISADSSELPMMRLSQKFEFSASHRLHNPSMSDAENRETFGKCNNPLGHGHNYEVQVTLLGSANGNGVLIDVPAFEQVVAETVIKRFDHKHLNSEVPQFRELIPTVENIAKVIYELLAPKLKTDGSELASVTVWETPKTWCEYSR